MILNIYLQRLDQNDIFGLVRSDAMPGNVQDIASVPIEQHIYIVNTKKRKGKL